MPSEPRARLSLKLKGLPAYTLRLPLWLCAVVSLLLFFAMADNDFVVKPQLTPDAAATLVFHVVLFILAFIALIGLFRLPRAIARFWRVEEWTSGHILYHTSDHAPRYQILTKNYPTNRTLVADYPKSTDDSHTLYSYAIKAEGRIDDDPKAPNVNYPPHVPSLPRFLRRLSAHHHLRIAPNYSISQGIIAIVWFSVMLYAGLYKSSPFSDPVRSGWVAIAQVPFVIALATKNNILGNFLGFTYEKLNFLHRFVGRLVVLGANIHSLGYIYQWSQDGTIQQILQDPAHYWGLGALIAFDCIALFSLQWFRQRFYNLFVATHIVGMASALAMMWLHKSAMMPYILCAIAIFGLDYVTRIVKTRVSTAILRPLPDLDSTRIEIPNINGGWRAGQHVRLRVLSKRMGYLGWTEVHPFTIASATKTHEGLILIAKKGGDWSNKLFDMAGGYVEAGIGRDALVMIEGPYGGPGHAMFASFSGAVFVTGGSGITFALSTIQDIINEDLNGRSRVKDITLVWVVQTPASVNPLLPLFANMIQSSLYTPVHIRVHYTRAGAPSKLPFSPPGFSLSAGRPVLGKVLEDAIARTVSLGSGPTDSQRIQGVLVGVCGPVALVDAVSEAVGLVDPSRRDQVGGIEMHEEMFG